MRVRAEVTKTGGSSRKFPFKGVGRPSLSQPALHTREDPYNKHEQEQIVNELAAPNRRFAQGLQHMPHPTVLDALARVPRTSGLLILYTELKDKQVVSDPCICAGNFRMLSPFMSEFIVTSTAVALHVAIDTEVEGRFSDNNFILLPWEPKVVAFLYDHSTASADELEHSMMILSLVDTNVQL